MVIMPEKIIKTRTINLVSQCHQAWAKQWGNGMIWYFCRWGTPKSVALGSNDLPAQEWLPIEVDFMGHPHHHAYDTSQTVILK